MSEEPRSPELTEEFDLDEDLFDFASVDVSSEQVSEEDLDLDEIFATLEEPEDDTHELDAEELEPRGPLPAEPQDQTVQEEQPLEDLFAEHEDDGELIGTSDSSEPPRPAEHAPATATPARARAQVSENATRPPTPPPYRGAPSTIRVQQDGASSRGWIFVMLAVTSINALVAIVTVRSTGQIRDSVWEGVRSVSRTADDIRDGAFEKAEQLNRLVVPITAPNPEQHPTFELARRDIEEGHYSEARQRLYSLLTIVDRLDESERDEVESRANYMIAQTLHLEAVSTESAE